MLNKYVHNYGRCQRKSSFKYLAFLLNLYVAYCQGFTWKKALMKLYSRPADI